MYTFANRDDGLMAYDAAGALAAHITTVEVVRYTDTEKYVDANGVTRERPVVREKMNLLPFDRWWIRFTGYTFTPAQLRELIVEAAKPEVTEAFKQSKKG